MRTDLILDIIFSQCPCVMRDLKLQKKTQSRSNLEQVGREK